MLETLVAVGPLFFLLVFSELLWRARILRGEPARKLLHVIIGSYVAVWPFFMTFAHIRWVCVAMLLGVIVSHKFHVFHAINDVKRHTWGDIFYAVGLFLAASLATAPWIFALAVLHMSFADGMAGLVGSALGKKHQYTVLGSNKSVVGTVSFVVSSLIVLMVFKLNGGYNISAQMLIAVPLLTATLENFGPRGTDNILVPLCIVLLFR